MLNEENFKLTVLRTFLRNSADMIFIKDARLKYVDASDKFLELVGYSRDSLTGKTDYDLFNKELADEYTLDDKRLFETGKQMDNKVESLPDEDGSARYSSTSKRLIYGDDGSIVGMYGIGRDITAKLKLEREAKEANAVKEDFLARMSHDMRTPMNGIIGLIELSRNEKNLDVIAENLRKMSYSANYLLSLINDTLDMNKIEANKIVLCPEVFDSKKVLESVLASVRPTIDEKQLQFNIKAIGTDFLPIKADPVHLQQIFTNIVSNAVKFTPRGGKIDFVLECVSLTPTHICDKITVRDNGIGMSEEFLPHIFEPFAQEKSEITANYAGTGLGMPIVKRLIELMGGKIEINSRRGVGTEVNVWLTFERVIMNGEKTTPTTALKKSTPNFNGATVLLCEDDALNREIARRLLERVGMKVCEAANGQIAVEMFGASKLGEYSLVLMDIRMPIMDGLAATRAIRAGQRADAQSVAIIAMTANAFDEDVKKSIAAGMNAHLAKPIECEKLYETIAEFLPREGKGQ